MSPGTLLREAEYGHPRRFAPGESDLRMGDPGPCNADDRKAPGRLSSRDLNVTVLEDRQPACREQEDLSFSLLASAYESILAAIQRLDPGPGQISSPESGCTIISIDSACLSAGRKSPRTSGTDILASNVRVGRDDEKLFTFPRPKWDRRPFCRGFELNLSDKPESKEEDDHRLETLQYRRGDLSLPMDLGAQMDFVKLGESLILFRQTTRYTSRWR